MQRKVFFLGLVFTLIFSTKAMPFMVFAKVSEKNPFSYGVTSSQGGDYPVEVSDSSELEFSNATGWSTKMFSIVNPQSQDPLLFDKESNESFSLKNVMIVMLEVMNNCPDFRQVFSFDLKKPDEFNGIGFDIMNGVVPKVVEYLGHPYPERLLAVLQECRFGIDQFKDQYELLNMRVENNHVLTDVRCCLAESGLPYVFAIDFWIDTSLVPGFCVVQ